MTDVLATMYAKRSARKAAEARREFVGKVVQNAVIAFGCSALVIAVVGAAFTVGHYFTYIKPLAGV